MAGRFEWIADSFRPGVPQSRTLYWQDPNGVYVPCTGDNACMSPEDWAEALDVS